MFQLAVSTKWMKLVTVFVPKIFLPLQPLPVLDYNINTTYCHFQWYSLLLLLIPQSTMLTVLVFLCIIQYIYTTNREVCVIIIVARTSVRFSPKVPTAKIYICNLRKDCISYFCSNCHTNTTFIIRFARLSSHMEKL